MADADSITPTAAPAAPTSAPAAPVAEPVAAAPVTPVTPAPVAASVPTEAAPAAPIAAVAPVAAVPAPDAQLSLLGDEPVEVKAAEAKPAETKPADAPAVEAVKPVETPADKPAVVDAVVLPTYEPFKLPEGMTANEATTDFTKTLAEFEASKPTHEQFQAFGQKLVDQHAAVVQKALKDQVDYFVQLNQRQKQTDLETLAKDPVIGKGDPEALKAFGTEFVNRVARNGGTKEEVTEFRKFAKERGIDNAAPIIRVMNNLLNKIDKYEKESSKILPGTKPAAAAAPTPGKGMINTLYGGGRK